MATGNMALHAHFLYILYPALLYMSFFFVEMEDGAREREREWVMIIVENAQTFSISATFCNRPSSSLRMAAACSSDESSCTSARMPWSIRSVCDRPCSTTTTMWCQKGKGREMKRIVVVSQENIFFFFLNKIKHEDCCMGELGRNRRTCKALNKSWCSNFFTERICWKRS